MNITELSCVLLTFTGENLINPIHQTYDMFQGEEEGASPLMSDRYDADHYKMLSNDNKGTDTEQRDSQTPRY
jgi:hypothetical protein